MNSLEGTGGHHRWSALNPERLLVAVGLLLLIDSLLPWYRQGAVPLTISNAFGAFHDRTASAWASSSGWSVGVLLCVVSAFAGVWFEIRGRNSARRWWERLPVAGSAMGLVATVASWMAIPEGLGPRTARLELVMGTAAGPDRAGVVRDQLWSRDINVVWGYHCGLLLMVSVLVLLVLLSVRGGWTHRASN